MAKRERNLLGAREGEGGAWGGNVNSDRGDSFLMKGGMMPC